MTTSWITGTLRFNPERPSHASNSGARPPKADFFLTSSRDDGKAGDHFRAKPSSPIKAIGKSRPFGVSRPWAGIAPSCPGRPPTSNPPIRPRHRAAIRRRPRNGHAGAGRPRLAPLKLGEGPANNQPRRHAVDQLSDRNGGAGSPHFLFGLARPRPIRPWPAWFGQVE